MSIKPICFVATAYRRCLWLLLPNSSPSPYRVTCLLVKQFPPSTPPPPIHFLVGSCDSLSSHSTCGRLPFNIHVYGGCTNTNTRNTNMAADHPCHLSPTIVIGPLGSTAAVSERQTLGNKRCGPYLFLCSADLNKTRRLRQTDVQVNKRTP